MYFEMRMSIVKKKKKKKKSLSQKSLITAGLLGTEFSTDKSQYSDYIARH